MGFVSLENAEQFTDHSSASPENRATTELADADEAGRRDNDSGLGMFGDDWLDSGFEQSVSDEFVPTLNVTWVDENGEVPAARSVFSGDQVSVTSLMGRPGVVGRADSLARSPRHLPSLAAQLLADTWVVQSVEDALRLQAECVGELRFVTLQGELGLSTKVPDRSRLPHTI